MSKRNFPRACGLKSCGGGVPPSQRPQKCVFELGFDFPRKGDITTEVTHMSMLRSLGWLMLAVMIMATPALSSPQVSVGISVRVGPPMIPVYAQPMCPGPGYIWTPGYWAWGPDGYYWVPGTWVVPPRVGLLWTPGYWGWGGGVYIWHRGYWGPHVGFYGGINYGFGYTGVGYAGGYWDRGMFRYNRAVNNVNVAIIHNTYNRTVVVNRESRVSYNGGAGGISARPTHDEETAARERHMSATSVQVQHAHAASINRGQWQSVNHGRPAYGATERPGEFNRRPEMNRPAPGNMERNGPSPDRQERPNAAPRQNREQPQAHSRDNGHSDHGGDGRGRDDRRR